MSARNAWPGREKITAIARAAVGMRVSQLTDEEFEAVEACPDTHVVYRGVAGFFGVGMVALRDDERRVRR